MTNKSTRITKKAPQNKTEAFSKESNPDPCSEGALSSKRLSEHVLAKIREIAREEIQKALTELPKTPSLGDTKYPMAPQPTLIGKKLENAKRVKLSVIIDEELSELVKTAAREINKPYSQVIDNALYFYFNQPVLSFQKCSDLPDEANKK